MNRQETEWINLETDADLNLMAKTLNISPILAKILSNRNIRSKNNAIKYLNPDKRFMHEASLLKDLDKAAQIVKKAILAKKKIAVYGDYDVDGVMSTVIILKLLLRHTKDVIYYIPDREKEGYGMNCDAVGRIKDQGAGLVIAVDNGITALQEVRLANVLDMEVIIIDHHEPYFGYDGKKRRENLPEAAAIINHKQSGCTYPFKSLCAAGVCYKFSVYFSMLMGFPLDESLDNELFLFASIAAFCDVVSLTDENRVFAKNGLNILSNNVENIGLRALMEQRGLEGKSITSFDVGFVIGPCINAAGRLEKADVSVELFMTDDIDKAEALALRLSELNDTRKKMTQDAVKLAMETISKPENANDKIYVIYDENIHESIAGIVAGRIKEAANRPVLMITKSGDLAKGSARSIEAYNIFQGLSDCKDLFVKFGGHEMAAGFSLEPEKAPALRERLNAGCMLKEDDFLKKVYIDAEIKLSEITFALAGEINRMEPFGRDNAEPVFKTLNVYCPKITAIGSDKRTLSFELNAGAYQIKGVAFGLFDTFICELENGAGKETAADFLGTGRTFGYYKMDIVYNIGINEYMGKKKLQIRIVDIKNISEAKTAPA